MNRPDRRALMLLPRLDVRPGSGLSTLIVLLCPPSHLATMAFVMASPIPEPPVCRLRDELARD
jgi:hypothetical protein